MLYIREHNHTIIRINMNTAQYLPQSAYKELMKNLKYADLTEEVNVIAFQATHGKHTLEFFTHVDEYEFAIEFCYKREGEDFINFKPTNEQFTEMNKILSEKFAEYKQNIDVMRQAEFEGCWEEQKHKIWT